MEKLELTPDADVRSAWRMLVRLRQQPGRTRASTLADWLAAQTAPDEFVRDILRDAQALLVEARDETGANRADVSALIEQLPPEMLGAALRTEAHPGWRRDFLLLMVDRLAPEAAVRVVEVATGAVERPMAAPIRAVVDGFVRRAVGLPGDDAAGDELKAALSGWVRATSEEPVHALMRGFESLYDRRVDARLESRATPEAERILQLSIEAGVAGRITWQALSELTDAGRGSDALDMLANAPESNTATQAIASRFATARELGALLREDPADFAKVDLIVGVMGLNATAALVEALAEARSRLTRRNVFDRLVALGPGVLPFVELRLRDSRWFVVRNMLGLMRALDQPMPADELERFLTHSDGRVRREALLLLMQDPVARDRAMAIGLKDPDALVLRTVLQELKQSLPDAGVPVLSKRLREGDFPAELRARALQLLGRKTSTLALDALLHYAQVGRTLLGKPKLAPPSAEMVAAIAGLAHSWRHDTRARAILLAAERSADAEVVKAARPQTGES